jgi:hypothetical protein
MATQTPDFPLCREAAAFQAITSILSNDAGISSSGVRIRSWDGGQNDGVKISFNQGPTLLLSPKQGDNRIITRKINTVPLVISMKLYAQGLVATDLVNFWGAVRKSLVREAPYSGGTVAAYLKARVNCYRYYVETPGYGAWEDPHDPPTEGLMGEGKITMDLQVAQ